MALEQLANQILQRTGGTAIAIGVLDSRGQVNSSAAGLRRRRGSILATTNDCWHIGSIGKSCTALLIALLFEDAPNGFESKVQDLLPDVSMHTAWNELTLYHLLTATSGLPHNFPSTTLRIQEDDPEKLREIRKEQVERALSKPPKKPCGTEFCYSNIGYTVLGLIAETLADETFENLLRERIFAPLNLNSAGYGAPKGTTPDEQPMGHYNVFGFKRRVDPFKGVSDLTPLITPAGRLHMNVFDMLKYGKAHLDGERGLNAIVKTETWKLLHQPNLNNYGCGWVCQETDWTNGKILWHNGSNNMWYALLVLVPNKDTVIAFASNDGEVKRNEQECLTATKKILSSDF